MKRLFLLLIGFYASFLHCRLQLTQQESPNIVLIVTDEEIKIPRYWEDIYPQSWIEENFPARTKLKKMGINFHNHFVGATACNPSRGVLYTGQYSNITGLSQTDGMAKSYNSPSMTWLKPFMVPTIGNWLNFSGMLLENIGYFGKWHLSHLDIMDDNETPIYTIDPNTRKPIWENINRYHTSHPLKPYGFSNTWVGPEPHGKKIVDSGHIKDPFYTDQVIGFLQKQKALYDIGNRKNFFVAFNAVNPHDTVLSPGIFLHALFDPDTSIPVPGYIPQLDPKYVHEPEIQKLYRETYPHLYSSDPIVQKFFGEQEGKEYIHRLYFELLRGSDKNIMKILETLESMPYYNDTIVLLTSDHGDLLGTFGYQKWHTLRPEVTNVPFIVANPQFEHLNKEQKNIQMPTSHADVLPTILGLLNINQEETAKKFEGVFAKNHKLVGKDLSPLIFGKEIEERNCVYMRTDDQITQGDDLTSKMSGFVATNTKVVDSPYHIPTSNFQSIEGLSYLESIVVKDPDTVWQLVRYYNEEDTLDEYYLYDLENDIYVTQNQIASHESKFEELKLQLIEERMKHMEPPLYIAPKAPFPEGKNALQ